MLSHIYDLNSGKLFGVESKIRWIYREVSLETGDGICKDIPAFIIDYEGSDLQL